MEPHILYEDSSILAVDKPANLVVHQTVDQNRPNLLNNITGKNKELFLINRLDKDTSGIVLIGKNRESATIFSKLFAEKDVEKKYFAIVEGEIDFTERLVSNHLDSIKGLKNIYGSVRSGGKKAETLIKRLSTQSGFSLVEANPKTGRTHQIRVHLAELGFPIVGDLSYGASFRHQFRRVMLHAQTLTFTHPIKKERLTITSPFPNDFKEALNYLGLQNS